MLIFIFLFIFLGVLESATANVIRCSSRKRWHSGITKYIVVEYNKNFYVHASCESAEFSVGGPILCVNGFVQMPLPQCHKIGCGNLSVPKNGWKSCDKGAPATGTWCRFGCMKTHYLTGTKERQCSNNLQWTGVQSWCRHRPECPVPELGNGTVVDCSETRRPLYEDTCSFRCNDGFELVGPTFLTCRKTQKLTDNRGQANYPRCIIAGSADGAGQHSVENIQPENTSKMETISVSNPCRSPNKGGCHHLCRYENGLVRCYCRTGYKLLINGKTCQKKRVIPSVNEHDDRNVTRQPAAVRPPVDSCSRHRHRCVHFCQDGECKCRDGYYLLHDRQTCSDINECLPDNFGCSNECRNTAGGAYCSCPGGYQLMDDNKNCIDLDECRNRSLHRCDHECYNTQGSYQCSCHPGHVLTDARRCESCRINSYRSDEDITCIDCPPHSGTDSEGRTSLSDCRCNPGFVGDPASGVPCHDVDECANGNFGCSDSCINTPGGALCTCPPGFELQSDNKTCSDTDECSVKNAGCQGHCHNTLGSFVCACSEGFIASPLDRYVCHDVDECEDENGGCSDLCINFQGGYHCSCSAGYRLNMDGRSCTSVRCSKVAVPNHSTLRCFPKNNYADKVIFKPGNMSDSTEFIAGTVCRLKCDRGYKLEAARQTIECQDNGKWNGSLSECEGLQCPPLEAPENGDVNPPECLKGLNVKKKCYFSCHSGYRLVGKEIFTCKNHLTWDADVPSCEEEAVIPFISCPADMTLLLGPNENSSDITVPIPRTNMRLFQVNPDWVVVGQITTFPAGKTDVTFTVASFDDVTNSCTMTIDVLDEEHPRFQDCPDSFNVSGSGLDGIQVQWEEPRVIDNVGLQSVLKTLEPNSILTPGVHLVSYVAKDLAGNIGQCSFEIRVTTEECEDLLDPENGEANCVEWMLGKICEPTCYPHHTRGMDAPEFYTCDDSGKWLPSNVISPCFRE